MRRLLLIGLILSLAIASLAQQKPDSPKLPVKRIILYSNGIGYFERQGTVNGSQNIELEFTGNQMNDVLKSLLLLDLNGGRVASATYNTAKPMEKQLERFTLNLNGNKGKSLTALIGQLVGTRVEIKTSANSVEGKVIGLETRQQQQTGSTTEVTSLVISSNDAMLQSFDLTEIKGIRILDAKIRTDLEQYLEILNTSHKKAARNLVIAAEGEGTRKIVAGYTIEAPIWKTSYRIVLDEKGKPFVQGWAIVDNEQDEDWDNVQLSLISGSPISFVQDLDSARYRNRPIIPYRQAVALAPKTYEDGVDGGAVAGAVAGVNSLEAPSPPSAAAGRSAGRNKSKNAAANVAREIDRDEAISQSNPTSATGGAIGELFEYKVERPVTIRHNSSALIPILNSKLDGEKVSIFTADGSSKNPFSGILLHNTTKLTLEAGPLTVFDGNTYAGEGLLDRFKPEEKRYIVFAADLGMSITNDQETSMNGQAYLFKAEGGYLKIFTKKLETKTYVISNKDDKAKTLIMEHPRRPLWSLRGNSPKELLEKTENFLRFRLTIEPKSTIKFPVVEEMSEETNYLISDTTTELLKFFVSEKYINEEVKQTLQKIMELNRQLIVTNNQISMKNTRIQQISADQGRLRENIKAIGKSEEEKKLLARYTDKLNQTEDELDKLKSEIKTLTETRDKNQEDLNKIVSSLDGYEKKL